MKLGTKQKLILLNTWVPWAVLLGIYYLSDAEFVFSEAARFTEWVIITTVTAISGGSALAKWVEAKREGRDTSNQVNVS